MLSVGQLRITMVQMDIEWENPALNREKVSNIVSSLKGITDLILFPETFTTGFSTKSVHLAEPMDGPTINLMQQLAIQHQTAVGGSLIIKDNQQIFNRFVFIYPNGDVASYDKRHLFSIGDENGFFQNGTKRVVIDYAGWRIMPLICYDLRFPVWSRNRSDVDLLIYVANWPSVRSDVWKTLLKARAIENQLYVAGVNRVGEDGNSICYSGESLLYGPRGEQINQPPLGKEQWSTYTISLYALNNFREKFPVAGDADDFEIFV